MATVHSTEKGRNGRTRSSRTPRVRAKTGTGSKAAAKRASSREHSLPGGLIDAVEEQRSALSVALTLLTSLDLTLQEEGGGDILDEEDAADVLVLRARAIARPVDLVRWRFSGCTKRKQGWILSTLNEPQGMLSEIVQQLAAQFGDRTQQMDAVA